MAMMSPSSIRLWLLFLRANIFSLVNKVDGGALLLEGMNEALQVVVPEVRCFKKELGR
jgi:hypothetical protein